MNYRKGVVVFALNLLFVFGCSGEPQIVFSEELFAVYPSNPEQFKQQYGGTLIYYPAKKGVQQKMANINKAIIDGDGYQVVFWKAKGYYIHHIIFRSNAIKVGGVALIGKSVNEVIGTFGEPTQRTKDALIYMAHEITLTVGFENGVITDCYWGHEV